MSWKPKKNELAWHCIEGSDEFQLCRVVGPYFFNRDAYTIDLGREPKKLIRNVKLEDLRPIQNTAQNIETLTPRKKTRT